VLAVFSRTPRLLEDHILMASAAQDSRDFIRMLAEVFRVRGEQTLLSRLRTLALTTMTAA